MILKIILSVLFEIITLRTALRKLGVLKNWTLLMQVRGNLLLGYLKPKELGHLKQYLNNLSEMFFHPEIEIRVRVIADREIPNDIFDYLRDYVDKH